MRDLVRRGHAVLVFNQRSFEEIFGMILLLGNHPGCAQWGAAEPFLPSGDQAS